MVEALRIQEGTSSEESSPKAGSDEAEDQDPLPRRSGRVWNTLRDDDLSMEGMPAYRRKGRFISMAVATLLRPPGG